MAKALNHRFLIYISYSYSFPICEPLQNEIKKRNYEVKWFCDEAETIQKFPSKFDRLQNVQEVLDFDPTIVLVSSDHVPDFFPGLKVQVFHGFISHKRNERNAHFRIRGLFDLYLTHGPSTTVYFKELAHKHGFFGIIETGFPKMDPLFQQNSLPKKHQIPVVIITSTFTKDLSLALNPEVFDEIKRLSETGKYKFLCTLHPKLDEQTKTKFESLNNANFTYYDTTDFTSLFLEADAMLSDTTSAIVEFLMLKKPVVTINTKRKFSHLINVTEPSKIDEALQLALQKPAALMHEIDEYVDFTHPYFDGKSSPRVIDAVIDFYDNGRKQLKKKPFNLVRKIQMRKKLGYPIFKGLFKP